MDKIAAENSICERCGRNFACGANDGRCWCFDLQLPAEVLSAINKNHDQCLCVNCLEQLAISDESGLASTADENESG